MMTLHLVLAISYLTVGNAYMAFPFYPDNSKCNGTAVSNSSIYAIRSSGRIISRFSFSGSAITSSTISLVGLTTDYLDIDTFTDTLYITDTTNHQVKKITTSSSPYIISDVAGIFGQPGSTGDGSPATSGYLKSPKGISIDRVKKDIYVADSLNFKVRKIDSFGKLTTVVGTGNPGCTFVNQVAATEICLGFPIDVAIDAYNDATATVLYIADYNNGVLMMHSTGIINVISPVSGGFGPTSITVDMLHNCIYYQNSKIWKMSLDRHTTAQIAGGGTGVILNTGYGVNGTSANLPSVAGK